ncbi:MAG: glycosyltransferase family 4 protein [Alphaproteobacteria bacterium]|nr:glycosyltransferase family 4 protein [Alphaproteobacteria bacterium]
MQVIPDLAAGGAERTTIEVARALHDAGAHALVASAGGRLEPELTAAGGELLLMPGAGSKNPLTLLANARTFAAIIRERRVDLVHARSRAPAWSALWAARRTRRPFVTTYHGVYNARGGLKRFYNSVMARGDVVIANSEFTAEHVRAEHPEAAGRIATIPRGVDIAEFSAAAVSPARRAALASAWTLSREDGRALILLAGRLTGWKGQREAINAAALLAARRVRPWRMVLAGDPQGREAYVAELHQLIARHGLDDRVTIVGHCSDMPAAFSLADIVIAPSNEPEAFGRVAAEAGAMGRPVIGSDVGGQREIIVHGETGLLILPRDSIALAGAMADLLNRGAEGRNRMGEAAVARVRGKFTTAALQQATLAVYDRLIGRPS